MSGNTRTRGDKRKNSNWDLLPPKPVKETIAFSLYKTHVEGLPALPTERNDDNIAVQLNIEDQWKNLVTREKHPYMSSAASLYSQQISVWQNKKRELKRPAGAFAMFMTDMWTEEKSKGRKYKLGEISHRAKLAWSRASTATKLGYKTKAKEALIRYNAFYEGFRLGKCEGVQDNHPPNNQDNHPPNQDNHPPNQDHHPPNQDHHPPNQDHHPPNQDNHPPNQDNHPPNQDHHPPNQDHHPPNQDHHPPNQDHHPPNQDHHPPNQDHHPPNQNDSDTVNDDNQP